MRIASSAIAVLAAIGLGAGVAQAAQQCCSNGTPLPWKGYNKGVVWKTSLESAKREAAAQGKGILLYQLVGDLDKEGC